MDAYKQINGALQQEHQNYRYMWIITGPAGCGKSSVAGYLAKELSIPYIEGDDVIRQDSTALPRYKADVLHLVPLCFQPG